MDLSNMPAAFSSLPAAFLQGSAVTVLPKAIPGDSGNDVALGIQRPRAGQAVVALLEGTAGGRSKAVGAAHSAVPTPTLMMGGQQSFEPVSAEVMAAARAGKLVQTVASGGFDPMMDPAMLSTMMTADPNAALLGGLGGLGGSLVAPPTVVPPLVAQAGVVAAPNFGLDSIVPVGAGNTLIGSGVSGADASGPKLVPMKPDEILPPGVDGEKPEPLMAAMRTPVTEGLMQGGGLLGPSAVELLQQAATDANGAVNQINAMMGPGTCDASTVQAAAMQLTMRTAYAFATNLAKTMGYHSLEHYELHKQAIVKAQNNRGKKGGGKGGRSADSDKKLTLFVGGLKKETGDDKLREHFSRYGEVTRADVICNVDGTSRGFGFVKFSAEAEIQACMDAKFEHILDGQWVNVKISDPNRADAGKNASRAVEMAAAQAGVEPSQYLNYLTELAQTKYGYANDASDVQVSSSRSKPY